MSAIVKTTVVAGHGRDATLARVASAMPSWRRLSRRSTRTRATCTKPTRCGGRWSKRTSADAYFAAIEKDDIKERLRLFTDDAIARGVFGVPTFFVGERMCFGQDRLRFVRLALLED